MEWMTKPERNRIWREKNRERLAAYREEHRDEILERQRQRYDEQATRKLRAKTYRKFERELGRPKLKRGGDLLW